MKVEALLNSLFLNSVDELQRLESQISETSQQFHCNDCNAARCRSVQNLGRFLLWKPSQSLLKSNNATHVLKAQQPGEIFNSFVVAGSVIGSGVEVMRIVWMEVALRPSILAQ